MASLVASNFKVEKLPDAEVQQLTAAQTELDAAQKHFDEVSLKIKLAHGQTPASNFTNAGCIAVGTSVELRGEYALITSTAYNICGSTVVAR